MIAGTDYWLVARGNETVDPMKNIKTYYDTLSGYSSVEYGNDTTQFDDTFPGGANIVSNRVYSIYCTYNASPIISNPYPANGSSRVPTGLTLNITLNDPDGDLMNVSWYSNSSGSWQPFANYAYHSNSTSYSFETETGDWSNAEQTPLGSHYRRDKGNDHCLKLGGYEMPFNMAMGIVKNTAEDDICFAALNSVLVRQDSVVKGGPGYGLTVDNISFVKSANPSVHIATYHSLIAIKNYDPKLSWINESHPEWKLYCANCSTCPVRWWKSGGVYENYIANISNLDYREFWINRTRDNLNENGKEPLDAIFLDVAAARHHIKTDDPGAWNCTPQGYTNESWWYTWKENVSSFIDDIYSNFSNEIVIANSIKLGYWLDYENGSDFLGLNFSDNCSGVVGESWIHKRNQEYIHEENWVTLLDLYIDVLKNKNKSISIAQNAEKFNDRWNSTWRMFGYASALLINHENFSFQEFIPFETGKPQDQIMKYPFFYIPIGEPKEELKDNVSEYINTSNNYVYERQYKNGLVLVNPNETATKTYELPKEMIWINITGNNQTTYETVSGDVSLPPVSGAIFLEKQSPQSNLSYNLTVTDHDILNISYWVTKPYNLSNPYSSENRFNATLNLMYYNGTGWTTIRTINHSDLQSAVWTHYYDELPKENYSFTTGSKMCWNVSGVDMGWFYLEDVDICYVYTGNLVNGTYEMINRNFTEYNTTYWWNVSVNDGTNTNDSGVFHFLTAQQSKIDNTDSTDMMGYLLMQVQYWNTTQETWVLANDTINETTPRTINAGDYLALDTIFNGIVNTSGLSSFGNGTYRVYVALRDPDYNVLVNDDGSYMRASSEFTITFT